MKRLSFYFSLVFFLILPQRSALAAIACELRVPRCTVGYCGVDYSGYQRGPQDFIYYFLAGSHKSPQYSNCPTVPAGYGFPFCTNDNFRSPSSWDTNAGTSDYVYLWYTTSGGPNTAGAQQALDAIFDDSLQRLMYTSDWNAIASISYVDIDVAWSTYNTEGIVLGYDDPINGAAPSSTLLYNYGNFPNGTLSYWRLTTDPTTRLPWTKTKFTTWREWDLMNAYTIDYTYPGGLFIQSITETVGFQFNGTSCPYLAVIIH